MLAALAGGSAAVSLISAFPWMMTLSRYKGPMFLTAGILIGANGVLTLRPQGKLACALTGGRGCEIVSAREVGIKASDGMRFPAPKSR